MAGIGAIVLIFLLVIGAPIFAVLIGVGAFGSTFGRGMVDFSGQVSDIIGVGTSEKATVLSTIPLFILAGYLLAASNAADRLVKISQAGLGFLPGSLAVVTIFACAIFTTFTGGSGVTIVALGGLLMPALTKQGYPEKFSLGLIGGTGSVGLLFPPALPLFVYGTVFGFVYQTTSDSGVGAMELVDWDTKRFLFAGVVPGMVLVGIMSVYSMIRAERSGVKRDWNLADASREFGPALIRALPEISIPFLVIAAIIKGVTIPQAAALTLVYVFVLEMFVYKDIVAKQLPAIMRDAMGMVGAIFIIIFCASAFSNWLTTAHIPPKVAAWITSTFHSKESFLLALNVVLLFVGMTMDIFSAIVVVVPLMTPAAMAYGINPYHLGVIFLLNLEIGYLTPPVGLNLFITSHTFRRPVDKVVRATFPFLLCMVAALIVVTYVPSLTIYPEAERRGRVVELYSRVKAAAVKASSVQEVTLPGGKVFKLEDCEKLTDDLARVECSGIFADVTQCRKSAGGDAGSPCEKAVLKGYAASIGEGGGDDDDDDWGGDDVDAGAAGGDRSGADAGAKKPDDMSGSGGDKKDDNDWSLDDDAGAP